MTAVVTDDLLLKAAVDMRKLPTVSILAYTGGIMRVPGWGEVVIDLVGLDASSSVAILSDHDSSRGGIVGHGHAEVRANRLMVTGSISATGQAASEIVESSKNGFPWQASVGVEVIEREQVRAGQSVEVNGRNIEAPAGGFTLVTKGRLREVSIVGVGCDGDTVVSIAAQQGRKVQSMETQVQEQQMQQHDSIDAEAIEAKRVANISSICGAKHPEIQAKAVEEGWDETRTELEVLRSGRPRVAAAWRSEPTVASGSVLEAAVLSHMGMMGLGEKTLGPVAMEQADRLGASSMIDLCRAALRFEGREVPTSRMELVKAALTTMSLPVALGKCGQQGAAGQLQRDSGFVAGVLRHPQYQRLQGQHRDPTDVYRPARTGGARWRTQAWRHHRGDDHLPGGHLRQDAEHRPA